MSLGQSAVNPSITKRSIVGPLSRKNSTSLQVSHRVESGKRGVQGVQGVQEFRSSGVQEFRSSGVQEFRSSGVQEFRRGSEPRLQAENQIALSVRLNESRVRAP